MNPKREELMELIGGPKCVRCNNSDVRVLEIDHVFGNGKEMPLAKKAILEWYLENSDIAEKELQVLCRNCHRIKSLENGDLGRRKELGIVVKSQDIPRNILDNMDWYRDR